MLSGMDQIAKYCKQSRNTILSWIADKEFPAKRIGNGKWVSSEELINDWIKKYIINKT